jgi:hypothetical protein
MAGESKPKRIRALVSATAELPFAKLLGPLALMVTEGFRLWSAPPLTELLP